MSRLQLSVFPDQRMLKPVWMVDEFESESALVTQESFVDRIVSARGDAVYLIVL